MEYDSLATQLKATIFNNLSIVFCLDPVPTPRVPAAGPLPDGSLGEEVVFVYMFLRWQRVYSNIMAIIFATISLS